MMLTVLLIRVETLSNVLIEGSISLPKLDLTYEQTEFLANIVADCQSVLNSLRETLEKYQKLEIDPKSYNLNLKDLRVKIHKGWGELKWNGEILADTQDRISSYIQSLNDLYGQIKMYSCLSFRSSTAQLNLHRTAVLETKKDRVRDGVDPDYKDRHNRTPLSWAVGNGHELVMKLLLAEDGVNPDSKDENNRTPLWWAVNRGCEGAVKLLLAQDGVDPEFKNAMPEFKDEMKRSPLLWAAIYGHEDVVKLLLAKDGVDPDFKDVNNRTPLSWAAASGHRAVVKLLRAEERVNPDSKDRDNRTPLSRAAENGHESVVKLLLAKDGVDGDLNDGIYWG